MTREEQREAYGLMKNDELIQLIEAKDLKIEAKNPSKPNKTEMIDTLMKQKEKEDYINGIDYEDEEPEVEVQVEVKHETKIPEVVKPATRKLTRQQKARIKFLDLSIKERVLVHDTMTTQTKDEVRFIAWGNRFMGYHNDIVHTTGKAPQYIRRGALNVLRKIQHQEYYQDEIGGPMRLAVRPRFTVIELDGLSDEEIAVLATQQNLRNAKFA